MSRWISTSLALPLLLASGCPYRPTGEVTLVAFRSGEPPRVLSERPTYWFVPFVERLVPVQRRLVFEFGGRPDAAARSDDWRQDYWHLVLADEEQVRGVRWEVEAVLQDPVLAVTSIRDVRLAVQTRLEALARQWFLRQSLRGNAEPQRRRWQAELQEWLRAGLERGRVPYRVARVVIHEVQGGGP